MERKRAARSSFNRSFFFFFNFLSKDLGGGKIAPLPGTSSAQRGVRSAAPCRGRGRWHQAGGRAPAPPPARTANCCRSPAGPRGGKAKQRFPSLLRGAGGRGAGAGRGVSPCLVLALPQGARLALRSRARCGPARKREGRGSAWSPLLASQRDAPLSYLPLPRRPTSPCHPLAWC